MKRLFPFLILILFFSCKKNSVEMPIIGKWREIEIYNGFTQGCSCWIQVSPMYADILDFTLSGKYKIERPAIFSSIACPGRYRLINDSTIGLTEDCGASNPSPEAIGNYSQSLKQLTIEYNYPSFGIIKYKYIKL